VRGRDHTLPLCLLVGGAVPLRGGRLRRLPGIFQTRGIGQRGDAQILIPFQPILEDYKAGTFSSSRSRDALSLAPAPLFTLFILHESCR